ncbi:hypothetical protein [Pantoea sp.]|uniref:hypothetical protein n=1 Tax=Pantoea sp. TaxID=69393 RepID=UPI00289C7FAB|nr:hypothetical protein [Pantoea sp.]
MSEVKREMHYGKNVEWFLDELACTDPASIDSSEFEVYGEGPNGGEGCASIEVTNLAEDALNLIQSLRQDYDALQQKLDAAQALAGVASDMNGVVKEGFAEVVAQRDEWQAMAKELLTRRKDVDKYRIQGVQIVMGKTQQARERLSDLSNFEDYEPYLDGLDDACQQVIKEIEAGTLPDKFRKPE